MKKRITTPAIVCGSWKEQRDKLKARFSILTDLDLNYEEGKIEEMLNKVRLKLGKTKEEMAKYISQH